MNDVYIPEGTSTRVLSVKQRSTVEPTVVEYMRLDHEWKTSQSVSFDYSSVVSNSGIFYEGEGTSRASRDKRRNKVFRIYLSSSIVSSVNDCRVTGRCLVELANINTERRLLCPGSLIGLSGIFCRTPNGNVWIRNWLRSGPSLSQRTHFLSMTGKSTNPKTSYRIWFMTQVSTGQGVSSVWTSYGLWTGNVPMRDCIWGWLNQPRSIYSSFTEFICKYVHWWDSSCCGLSSFSGQAGY